MKKSIGLDELMKVFDKHNDIVAKSHRNLKRKENLFRKITKKKKY